MTLLKQYRVLNELTIKEMANKLGISDVGYSNYEKGKRVLPVPLLLKFLKMRNNDGDKLVIKTLEEIYKGSK